VGENEEVIVLLREIRDVQKAHFEQYRLFTSGVMEEQKRHAAAVEQVRLDSQQARNRDIAMQEQMLRDMARGRVIVVVSAIVQTLCVGALALLVVYAALWK
jgi:hypothetical protein